jgi:hypothetical protein
MGRSIENMSVLVELMNKMYRTGVEYLVAAVRVRASDDRSCASEGE